MLMSFKHHLKVAGRESHCAVPRLITPVQFGASLPASRGGFRAGGSPRCGAGRRPMPGLFGTVPGGGWIRYRASLGLYGLALALCRARAGPVPGG